MTRRVIQLAVQTALLLALLSPTPVVVVDAASSSLRRNAEPWRLLEEATDATAASAQPVLEKTLSWRKSADGSGFEVTAIDQIVGDEAIMVFHDRSMGAEAAAEAALVTFDVRSSPNCVVSVCGVMRNWYLRASEQCWDLKIAPKSSDPATNGLISGISAAFTADRPVANKLYLKFDSVNYLDGSACSYEVLSGFKTNATQPVIALERSRA